MPALHCSSSQLIASLKREFTVNCLNIDSSKKDAKVDQNAKTRNFSRNSGQNDRNGSEISQTKKSQSRWYLTDFSAAPKRQLILVDVCVCYFMLRIVVNLLDNEFASWKFQVPFLKRKKGLFMTSHFSDSKPLSTALLTPRESTRPILLRLPAVQAIIPVSRSTWYAGIKSGLYPAPIKISARASAWRLADIQDLVEQFKH